MGRRDRCRFEGFKSSRELEREQGLFGLHARWLRDGSIIPAGDCVNVRASLIGRLGPSAFRPFTAAASASLAGSCFSPESAHRPFHHGIRRRGGTIFRAALPSACPSGLTNSLLAI